MNALMSTMHYCHCPCQSSHARQAQRSPKNVRMRWMEDSSRQCYRVAPRDLILFFVNNEGATDNDGSVYKSSVSGGCSPEYTVNPLNIGFKGN